jgi:hypothetical protein
MIGVIRWEREVVARLKTLFWYLPEGTDRNSKKKSMMVNDLTEIRTQRKSEALPLKLSCSVTCHISITT